MSKINPNALLIESHFQPSICYMALLSHFDLIHLESKEHYVKASNRNRTYLTGPNGICRLSVPLIKGKDQRTTMEKVRISYDHDWRKIHWQSLCSNYRRSPYFEYYEDELAPFYVSEPKYLLDYNLKWTILLCKLLKIKYHFKLTDAFEKEVDYALDMRGALPLAKGLDPGVKGFKPPVYHQVFGDRHPFYPNLSVLDLLFNEGPNAGALVKHSLNINQFNN